MTTVWELGYDFDKATAFALVDQTRGFFDQFDGRPLVATWAPVAISPADIPEDDAKLTDFTVLGSSPIASSRAMEALLPLVGDSCEFLPLRYPRREYFILNVTLSVDCLDEARSELTRFASGRVMRIDRYSFHVDRVTGRPVFRLPQLPRAFFFVTDPFVNAIESMGLTGLAFRKLWSSP